MSDPISTPPTESYFTPPAPAKAEGEPQGIPWVKRESPTFGASMECSVCHGLKFWHLFDRKTGKGICTPCYLAGNRFGEKEG